MSDNNPKQDGGDVSSLLAQMQEVAVFLDLDDLISMAKLHGWAEALTDLSSPASTQANAEMFEKARTLATHLEALVLGSAKNPDETLESVHMLIQELGTDAVTMKSGPSAESVQADPSSDGPAQTEPLAATETSQPATEPDTASAESSTQPEPPAEPTEPPYDQEPLFINSGETEFVQGFIEEATEHIEGIESAVLEVERAPEDGDKINDLFRPFHTIKGMAGFLNLRDINCVTHEVETLLDQGRKGDRKITGGLIDLVFEVVDILKSQISAIANYMANPNGEMVPQPPVVDMIGHLRAVVAGRIEPTTQAKAIPGSGACKVGENLVEQGSASQAVVDCALDRQKSGLTTEKTGAILIKDKAVTPKQVSQAIRPQTQAAAGQVSVAEQSVRIDTKKLDQLVDMVGELVIAQTLVGTNPQIADDPLLSKDVNQVGKIVREVQEVAMGMRMLPIGSTFQRMARLVRDVSRKAGKNVELHITGEETELDKNVIQQIGDPLVHMIRNAVDHGIENPEDRKEMGKNPTGNVHLSAYHHGGNIVIEIQDDGQGLDREKLIAKAVERGVVGPEEEISEQATYHLIFASGFSMADTITDISGRGVGMDVVKRNIEQLRGRIDITSEKGSGSTFSIRLPLTLAIIDGMIVRIGQSRFIIPTISIEQSLRPLPDQISTVQHKGELINVRGELVPVVQLGQMFGITDRIDPCEAMVVIAQCDDRKIGIVVEELIGQQQVVIKSLGERFERLRGISGAAILGDGRIGLILETLGIETLHNSKVLPGRIGTTNSALNTASQCSPHSEIQSTATVEAGVNATTDIGVDLDAEHVAT